MILAGSEPSVAQSGQARAATPLEATQLPPIRIQKENTVPECVTPTHLQEFLRLGNPSLDGRHGGIAATYRQLGEALQVRWDIAFFQMLLETNFLKFRRSDGSPGDVNINQNNFAGIGATGGGVPGERFKDVTSGVKAHIQHLVAYSGEAVLDPVAQRTRSMQDLIIRQSQRLGRVVRFDDLTNRWAADRNYARSIAAIANRYWLAYCSGQKSRTATAANQLPPNRDNAKSVAPPAASPPPSKPFVRQRLQVARDCSVMTASYSAASFFLIEAATAERVVYTALGVDPNDAQRQSSHFIEEHAKGGRLAGQFATRDAAVRQAYALCDEAGRLGR